MLISIHDSRLHRIGYLDNEKPDTVHFKDDTWHRYLSEATSTFDLTIMKAGADENILAGITEEHFLSFQYNGEDFLFNIMKVEETEDEVVVNCENLNLELITEQEPAKKASGAKTIIDYLTDNGIMQYAQLSIGINEVATRTRTLSWDGSATKLERLLSIVNQFDAECEFVTMLNRDGTLKQITLNIYAAHDDNHQGVGTRRQDVTLYYGKNLSGVRRTVDKTELYTAIRPLGTDDLTIANLDKTVKNSDGRIEFISKKGDAHILCPLAKDLYPSQIQAEGADEYINLEWSYDTKDANVLYSKALAKIKTVCQPAVTYEAASTVMLDIGDTITIHDDGFSPTLLLEARVSEQEISFSDPSKNKNTYSNFRALQNKLSKGIQDSSSQLAKDAAEAAKLAKEANEKAYAAQVAADAAGAINLIRNSVSCDFEFYGFRPIVLSDASGVILTDIAGAFLSA
ncbi:phage tail spike protein [Pseudoramibacter alactolyticus]|uniref:phage tail spike protein n=1 Tax=Pseudoramibacter alactolyticus TaxID=113287 RepID=UPI0028E210EA|nr:phage tail spike protein [Pseudoramibacter alactolyticus]